MSGFYGSGPGATGAPMPGNGGAGDQNQYQQQHQQQQPYAGNMQQWQPAPSPSNNMNAPGGSMQYNQGGFYSAPQQNFQQQQQQQPGIPAAAPAPFWDLKNPNTVAAMAGLAAQATAAGGLTNSNVLDWAVQGGSAAWKSGGASVVPGFDSAMTLLRTYFAVDNRYVKRKMIRVIFPFRSTQWKRMQTENHGSPESIQYALPISDDNAPDLYLPSMSLITYCLLCALASGTVGQFDPEEIPGITSKCFITQLIEVALIRLGFYFMQAPVPVLDLLSYTGYKYLGMCLNIIVGLMMGNFRYGATGYYVTFLWTASSAFFFMLKTMANNIPTVVSAAGPKREVMVIAFAASQVLAMWFIGQTKSLYSKNDDDS